MTLPQRALALLGTWARPSDAPAKWALGIGLVFAVAAMFGRGRSLLFGLETRDSDEVRLDRQRFLTVASLAAGLLSIAYISSYLRGGPRIIDATTYFLQGRALSHGHLEWTPLDPTSSFRGRFLLFREAMAGTEASLGGIFPPGYPLLLSFGFMLGAPMIVGPLLAMGLVIATYTLTRTLAEDVAPQLAEGAARAAALLSVVCAALRYHTADTMSHGATALFVTIALTFALRARRARLEDARAPKVGDARSPFDGGRLEAAVAGLATGYVIATRPISALPIATVVCWILWTTKVDGRRPRLVVLALFAVLPGAFLLLLSQRVLTGSWLTSTQRMYYAVSDGPPGCFRLGFGKGIGCLFEHGEFVEARLQNGYGLVAAAGTTLRRLHKHLLDIGNFELLALLVLVPIVVRRSRSAVLPAAVLVALQMLAYVPFYFDGDYPGGGARFFADVLPVEHALVMVGIAAVVSKAEATVGVLLERRFVRGACVVLAIASIGFAVHGSHEHAALRDRDGGRPMYEPDVVTNAGIKNALVFVDTDHGFNLGHNPSARIRDGIVVARLRSDDRDRLLYDALGKPPSYLYKFDPPPPTTKVTVPTLTPWAPPESTGARRYEAENEWPPLAQTNGFAAPVWGSACASGKRALVVIPEGGQRASVTISIPVPSAGRFAVEIRTDDQARLLHGPKAPPANDAIEVTAILGDARWTWRGHEACTIVPSKEVELRPPYARMTFEVTGGPAGIDYISLRKVH